MKSKLKLSEIQAKDLYFKALRLTKIKPPEFFNLRKMRKTVGLCYWTDIELDYRRDIIPTAFHELFHYIHPDWSESDIRYAESRVINICTPLEVATFLKHLANKLYKSELIKEVTTDSFTKKRKRR